MREPRRPVAAPRRVFLRQSFALAAAAWGSRAGAALAEMPAAPAAGLEGIASRLLDTWCDALLRVQVPASMDRALGGGLLCPACARIHGRIGDAVYPFLRQARTRRDERFVAAARGVLGWMENLSRPDGSWWNDHSSDWPGTTVFAVIALCRALRHHGDLLPDADRTRLVERLARAARFTEGFLTPTVGNVNYRMSGPLAFALAADILQEPRYRDRARELATIVRDSFLPSGLIFGEGRPNDRVSPRGCRAVDLGYNVGESLPNLAAYAVMADDRDLRALVARSMRAHLEFLLPDGGWDNSWGTRNYKWTYWGSRTADGAPAALVLADPGDPQMLEAAWRNLELLERCTHDGLLHGGPHLHLADARPCLHHTFSHAKMLASLLDHGVPAPARRVHVPRETARGVRHYREIETWLVARGPWRATVTATDWQYVTEGNASGGALTLLWHERVGTLIAASLTRYQLVEANNQVLHAEPPLTLTPGIEARSGGATWRSLNELGAAVTVRETADAVELMSAGLLRDGEQRTAVPPARFRLAYRFASDVVQVRVRCDAGPGARFALPIVSSREEPARVEGGRELVVARPGGVVRVSATQPLEALPPGRAFNHVPGFQAVPAVVELPSGEEVLFEIRIADK